MAARINRVSTIPAMTWTCRLDHERLKMSLLLTLTLTHSGWPRTLRMVTNRRFAAGAFVVLEGGVRASACMWRASFVPVRS